MPTNVRYQRERPQIESNSPEWGRMLLDTASFGIYGALSKNPVNYGGGIAGVGLKGFNEIRQKALGLAGGPIGAGINAGIDFTKSAGEAVKEYRNNPNRTGGELVGSLIPSAISAGKSIGGMALGGSSGSLNSLTDNPSAINSTFQRQINNRMLRTRFEGESPVFVAEGGLFVEGSIPRKNMLVSSSYKYPKRLTSSSISYPIENTQAVGEYVAPTLIPNNSSSLFGNLTKGDYSSLYPQEAPAVNDEKVSALDKPYLGLFKSKQQAQYGYPQRFETNINRATNLAGLTNMGSMILEGAYLLSRSKSMMNPAQRVDTVDPLDPFIPYQTARNMVRENIDRVTNSIIEASRSRGTQIDAGAIYSSINKTNAMMNETLAGIISEYGKTNAEIQYRNASILQSFRDSINTAREQNQMRKDQIWGALAGTPGKYLTSTFQNYIDSQKLMMSYKKDS